MTIRPEIEIEVDEQHGPIVRVKYGDVSTAVYLADETAVVTTPDGQYGQEITGPWYELRKAIVFQISKSVFTRR